MKRQNPPDSSQGELLEPGEAQAQDSNHDSTSPDHTLSRRRFLLSGMSAAALIAASASLVDAQKPGSGQGKGKGKGGGGGGGGGGQGGKGGRPPAFSALNPSSSDISQQFREPETAEARVLDGQNLLTLTLNLEMANWKFVCGSNSAYGQIPIYNGSVPAPTMLVDPGTRMRITLNNKLPTQSPFSGDPCPTGGMTAMTMSSAQGTGSTPPECFMHTNLHFHGLFVSPSSILKDGSLHCIPSSTGTTPNANCGPIDAGQIQLSSDDVLADVGPGETNNYCVMLPEIHEPGTYWYHAHIHGSTGYQVTSGMAGAIIVREPVGQEIVQPDRDKIFLMQEVMFSPTSPPPAIPPVYTENSSTQNSAGFLINGQCKPTLQMKTGQTFRWRFINATGTPRGLMKLRLIKMSNNPQAVIQDSQVLDCGPDPTDTSSPICPVYPNLDSQTAIMNLIAVDGLSFYGFPPQPIRKHLMAPGNRADFLINIPAAVTASSGPGKYVLVKDAFPKDAVSYNLQPSLAATPQNEQAINLTVAAALRTNQVLAYIEVYPGLDNEKLPATIPGTRPAQLQAITSVDSSTPRQVNFKGVGGGPTGGGQFMIDNQAYQPTDPGVVVKVNTAEEWQLQNFGGPDFPHPFHIHVNPFQIVGRTIDFEVNPGDRKCPPLDANNPCNWIWGDTAAIPAQIPKSKGGTGLPGQLNLRTRFLVFPGEYVIHCHILIHEDVGMMKNVTVQDDGTGVGPCVSLPNYTPAATACINRTTQPCAPPVCKTT